MGESGMHWAYHLRDPLRFRRLFLHFYHCVPFFWVLQIP